MKQQRERREVGAVVWNEEKRELKLCGEPVLEVSYRWPAFEGKRFVWANRCYSRLVKLWKGQWERELYLRACVDLAEKREASRPFTPWKASLDGELTLADENYRSMAMAAREQHGDHRVLEYRWGDTWRMADGSPERLQNCVPKGVGWKKRLYRTLAERLVGREDVCPDADAGNRIGRLVELDRFALTEQEVIFFLPQCAAAPAVEGAIRLSVSRAQV